MASLTTFSFNSQNVRTVISDGEPWFVAADVCRILKLGSVSLAINGNPSRSEIGGLELDEKGVYSVSTLGGPQDLLCVSESGLYALIFKSRKPQAKAFRRWVTGTVLPQIRKSGSFVGKLPSRSELAAMVIEQEKTIEAAGEIIDAVKPTSQYGAIGKNGLPKLGIRRAAYVAAKNRMAEAGHLLAMSAQMELRLAGAIA